MISALSPCMVDAHPDFKCPRCNGLMQRSVALLQHTFGGVVQCKSCSYRDSVMGYLGRSMIQVEPMTGGSSLIYGLK
jgi:transcription elongation factor Elf1